MQWAEKSGLTLTFEHVTWKSIGVTYLLRATPAPSLVLIKWRGLKYIEQTTQWAEKSGLTLTFEHVTWKSIGIIYSLRATPAPSLVLIKWRSQKILSGQHLVYRPTDRPTDSCIKNWIRCFVPSLVENVQWYWRRRLSKICSFVQEAYRSIQETKRSIHEMNRSVQEVYRTVQEAFCTVQKANRNVHEFLWTNQPNHAPEKISLVIQNLKE